MRDDVERSPYGHTFWRYQASERDTIFWYLDRPKIEEAIAILAAYSRRAREGVPKDEGGRSRDRGLAIWVTNAATFWAETLGREFTHNPHKGGGSTPAFNFCLDALKASGFPFTRAALGTQMSYVIAQRQKQQRP